MRGGGTIARPTQDVDRRGPRVRLRAILGGIASIDVAGRRQCTGMTCVHHWISSLTRSCNDGEIVMPSAFAVLRLIASSIFVG